jgi:peptide/nickel transport system permease protein
MSTVAPVPASPVVAVAGSRPRGGLFRQALRLWRTRIGLALVLLLVFIAIFGPHLAPFGPTDFAGAPNQTRGGDLRFGADQLGQDVWSRFLYGGRSILVLSVLATVIGLVLGTVLGLVSAYARNWLDDLLMRTSDVLLSFPSIMLALVVIGTVGPKSWLIVLAVALTTMPRVARVLRGAAVTIVERDFIGAAEALGTPRWRILAREVLPNVTSPLVVEASLRLTYAVGLVAALAFLGFAPDPNAADWGLMINENRTALTVQPWGVVLPAIAIALLTIGTGLIGDGLARASIGIDRERGV